MLVSPWSFFPLSHISSRFILESATEKDGSGGGGGGGGRQRRGVRAARCRLFLSRGFWWLMHKNPFSGKRSTEPFRKDYCHFYAYAFCGVMASSGNTVNTIELTPFPEEMQRHISSGKGVNFENVASHTFSKESLFPEGLS